MVTERQTTLIPQFPVCYVHLYPSPVPNGTGALILEIEESSAADCCGVSTATPGEAGCPQHGSQHLDLAPAPSSTVGNLCCLYATQPKLLYHSSLKGPGHRLHWSLIIPFLSWYTYWSYKARSTTLFAELRSFHLITSMCVIWVVVLGGHSRDGAKSTEKPAASPSHLPLHPWLHAELMLAWPVRSSGTGATKGELPAGLTFHITNHCFSRINLFLLKIISWERVTSQGKRTNGHLKFILFFTSPWVEYVFCIYFMLFFTR